MKLFFYCLIHGAFGFALYNGFVNGPQNIMSEIALFFAVACGIFSIVSYIIFISDVKENIKTYIENPPAVDYRIEIFVDLFFVAFLLYYANYFSALAYFTQIVVNAEINLKVNNHLKSINKENDKTKKMDFF